MPRTSKRKLPFYIEGTWSIGHNGRMRVADIAVAAMLFSDCSPGALLDVKSDAKHWHLHVRYVPLPGSTSDHALAEYTSTMMDKLQEIFTDVHHDLHLVENNK